MKCNHATDHPSGKFVYCSLNLYGGKPSSAVCAQCPRYEGPSRGVGDTVKKITTALGIHQAVQKITGGCGCSKRQALLNQHLPYGTRSDQ